MLIEKINMTDRRRQQQVILRLYRYYPKTNNDYQESLPGNNSINKDLAQATDLRIL